MGEYMKTAILFPGQGSQTVGMGKDLYDNFNIYKETFHICEQGTGLNLKSACFEGERMQKGEVVQPAIFAHTISLLKVLEQEGLAADVYAGLSLGEYSALAAANAIDIGKCAAAVKKRGSIMDNAFPEGKGGMLSVIGFDIDKVSNVIQDYENVYVANHLSELQIVVAGYTDDLLSLKDTFENEGAKMASILNVRGPSHAPLLNDAADEFSKVLKKIEYKDMQKTVYSNVLGKPYGKSSDIKKLLEEQMRSRVRWHDCFENMAESGVERYIEVGPSNVLFKLAKRRVGKSAVTVSVRDMATLDKFLSSN